MSWVALLFIGLGLPAAEAQDVFVAKVEYISGEVFVGRDGSWRSAEAGMRLVEGQHVRTGPSSRVRLRFIDGSSMQMGQHARAVVERYRTDAGLGLVDALLELVRGRARFIVRKLRRADANYRVRMRTVLIGVRGTDILAQADAGVEHVALVEGRVALTSPSGGDGLMLERGGYARFAGRWPVHGRAIPDTWLNDFILDVGLSSEGTRRKKSGGSDDAPPHAVMQQKMINSLGSPSVLPR